MLNIEKIAYFVPDTKRNIMNEHKYFDITENEANVFHKIYGLSDVAQCDVRNTHDFMFLALEKLFTSLEIDRKKIVLLIYIHTAKHVSLFNSSCIKTLQRNFKLDKAFCFSVSINNCASIISVLEMVSYFLSAKTGQKAVLVMTDKTFTPVLKVIPNVTIMGEASAALLLSNSCFSNRFLAAEIFIEGKAAAGIWQDAKTKIDTEKKYTHHVAKVIYKVSNRCQLNVNQIKYIIPHNVNMFSWKMIANLLNIGTDKIYLENINKYGHCFGADVFINLADVIERNLLVPGDYYILVSVGLGNIFAGALFQC